ncbi:MAG: PadR family transcriptional regulator [Bdellovibrio sp.]|nr:PadR family transcriptional regulator [Bdellovibrio sp.]
MVDYLTNWKAQIRRGYLELCILMLIQKYERIYGFDLLEKLKEIDLEMKEGTLYPLLNRMTTDKVLKAVWETENVKGHPRKFYSLTKEGIKLLHEMKNEYIRMNDIFEKIAK